MPTRRRSIGSARRREALLGCYVAPEVVAHIMSDGRTPLLSGVRLPVTVLFADMRNFTRLADRLPAERVTEILDQFFEAMTAAAARHRAVIDKLIGDAIMLVYGIPAAHGDEAQRALETAGDMHHAFLALLDAWRIALPKPLRLGLAIGCASGEAVLVNVGSAARMDYTIIGAVVNLAARLTAAAGSGETLTNSALRNAVRGCVPAARFSTSRRLLLKGFRGRVTVYPWQASPGVAPPPTSSTLSDPVCGMKVSASGALPYAYRGSLFYFCSTKCRTMFRRSPHRYVAQATHAGSRGGRRGRRVIAKRARSSPIL